MKAQYTESYYRNNWQKFLEPDAYLSRHHFINMELEMDRVVDRYKTVDLPEDVLEKALSVVIRIEAEKIAKSAKDLVMEEMAMVKEIECGQASFGMISERQEVAARSELRQRFEFNCLQLADFRKKYNV